MKQQKEQLEVPEKRTLSPEDLLKEIFHFPYMELHRRKILGKMKEAKISFGDLDEMDLIKYEANMSVAARVNGVLGKIAFWDEDRLDRVKIAEEASSLVNVLRDAIGAVEKQFEKFGIESSKESVGNMSYLIRMNMVMIEEDSTPELWMGGVHSMLRLYKYWSDEPLVRALFFKVLSSDVGFAVLMSAADELAGVESHYRNDKSEFEMGAEFLTQFLNGEHDLRIARLMFGLEYRYRFDDVSVDKQNLILKFAKIVKYDWDSITCFIVDAKLAYDTGTMKLIVDNIEKLSGELSDFNNVKRILYNLVTRCKDINGGLEFLDFLSEISNGDSALFLLVENLMACVKNGQEISLLNVVKCKRLVAKDPKFFQSILCLTLNAAPSTLFDMICKLYFMNVDEFDAFVKAYQEADKEKLDWFMVNREYNPAGGLSFSDGSDAEGGLSVSEGDREGGVSVWER